MLWVIWLPGQMRVGLSSGEIVGVPLRGHPSFDSMLVFHSIREGVATECHPYKNALVSRKNTAS